jgi:hypothetical protein
MSVGDILDRSLKLLITRVGLFYAIHLIVLSPLFVLELALPEVMSGFVGLLILLGLTLVLQPIATAAVLHVVMQDYLDRPVGLGGAFAFALGRFGPLFVASLVVGIPLGFGFVCCIVPGAVLYPFVILTTQIVVLERMGPFEAVGRSVSLSENYRLRILGVGMLVLLIGLIVSYAVALPLSLLLPYQEVIPAVPPDVWPTVVLKSPLNYYINVFATQLLSILVQSYLSVCMTLLYLDLRIRKEGFDLEMEASRGAPEELP